MLYSTIIVEIVSSLASFVTVLCRLLESAPISLGVSRGSAGALLVVPGSNPLVSSKVNRISTLYIYTL